MKQRPLLLASLILAQAALLVNSASAEIEDVSAVWKQEKEKLSVKAEEDAGHKEMLTAIYNGKQYAMSYNSEKERYELKLDPICYDKTISIVSSTGETKTKSVKVEDGDGSGYECTALPPVVGASAEIENVSAVWKQEKEKLSVKAEVDAGRKEMLTAIYNGKQYGMTYNSEKERYELKLDPICYDKTISIVSSTGETKTKSVKAEDGDGSGYECTALPPVVCKDGDGDGYSDISCGGQDCNDSAPFIFPGAEEICGDKIDQDCNGADLACETNNDTPHADLTFAEYPSNCLSCHYTEAIEMQNSTHYKWVGETPDMANDTGSPQGKLTNAVNSYCINIKGDWPVCGSCHVGRGKKPDAPDAGLENIDCLVCHNEEYATSRTRLADGSMGVVTPTDSMVRNIAAPTRSSCLSCHATAGGGDAVKRGDLSLATAHNNDPEFDVHMNSGGSDLSCQKCHVFENHLVIGKGSDIRPTDDLSRGSEISCTTCHTGKDSSGGHDNSTIDRHVSRVSCQTCHIPTYAKVATEVYRDWQLSHDGQPADGRSGPGHPYTLKEGNLVPEYKFWNRMSDNYLLGDDASLIYDADKDTYPTSLPLGDVKEGKIFPFKYKKANQPMTAADSRLIALDTFEYIKVSGDADISTQKGLVNMGYSAEEPYRWVETDTYQMLNHGISPSSNALECSSCHENTSRMDLQGALGYQLKGAEEVVCVQCHKTKEYLPFFKIHDKHVKSKQYDCSWCHGFDRPERGLRMP